MTNDALDLLQPLMWSIPRVLDDGECCQLIMRAEHRGFSAAPLMTPAGLRVLPETRSNSVVDLFDPALAGLLYERVRPSLPTTLHGMPPVSANSRLRCYRYKEGERFALHADGCVYGDSFECSALTLMLYLNEGFEGGATHFCGIDCTVLPHRGMALLFQHALMHEGCLVERGIKYVLRSDIMFRTKFHSRLQGPTTAR